MNIIQALLMAGCLALGFVVGRGTVAAPREKIVIRAVPNSAKEITDKIPPVGKALPEKKRDAPIVEVKRLTDWTGVMNRGERLVGLLATLAACPEDELPKFYAEMGELLRSGKLAAEDFDILVETMGARGSEAVAGLLLKDRSLTRHRRETLSRFFSNWASQSPDDVWSFIRKGMKTPPSLLDWSQMQGLVSGIRDEESPILKEILRNDSKMLERISFWRTEGMVKVDGFEGALKKALLNRTKASSENDVEFMGRIFMMSEMSCRGGLDVIENVANLIESTPGVGSAVLWPIEKYAQFDEAACFTWGQTLPRGDKRTNALGAAVFRTTMADPDKALKMVAELPATTIEEQKQLLMSLEDGFRQSAKVSKEELPDLMAQTQKLMSDLKLRK